MNYDDIKMDAVNAENATFLSWLQSFTKRVVTAFSTLYLCVVIVLIIMLFVQLKNGYTDGITTMISEINETFRVVIGGYLIKAGVENGFKITGSFLANINKAKLEAMNVTPESSDELLNTSAGETDDPDYQ